MAADGSIQEIPDLARLLADYREGSLDVLLNLPKVVVRRADLRATLIPKIPFKLPEGIGALTELLGRRVRFPDPDGGPNGVLVGSVSFVDKNHSNIPFKEGQVAVDVRRRGLITVDVESLTLVES